MQRCPRCGKPLFEFFKAACGLVLCGECWDEYIFTEEGKLEYLLGICRGEYAATEFDNDFLKEVARSWEANKRILQDCVPNALYVKAEAKAHVFRNL